jgi:hypothetical protein
LSIRTVIGGSLMVIAMLIVEWPSRNDKNQTVTPGLDPLVH